MIVFTQAEIDELKQQVNEHGEGYLHYANSLIERLFERKYGWDAIEFDEIRVYSPNAEPKPYAIFRPFKIESTPFDQNIIQTLSFDVYSHYPDVQQKHNGVRYYIGLFGKLGYFIVAFDTVEQLKDFAHWRELEVDYWRLERRCPDVSTTGT